LLSQTIDAEIEKRFTEPDRESVRTLLSDCEGDRLCLAILRLSRSKVARVEELVGAAKRDYRDVLAWASKPTRRYVVGLLRKGPNWEPRDENGRTHLNGKLLRTWKEQGAILVGGWFMDLGDHRGLYIFNVDSIEEAQALVQSDEAIQSGKLVFDFHPWLAPAGLKIASPDEL
jgi:uncharacterized protein YciI